VQILQGEVVQHVPKLFELWSSNKASRLTFAQSQNDPRSGTLSTVPPGATISAETPQATTASDSRTAISPKIDTGTLSRVQNLSLSELSERSGLNLLPVVLMQTSRANDGLIRVWPEPSVDADKNIGYATQWFGFAAICLFALLVFAWRLKRRP
jgi:hypothetical protein